MMKKKFHWKESLEKHQFYLGRFHCSIEKYMYEMNEHLKPWKLSKGKTLFGQTNKMLADEKIICVTLVSTFSLRI